MVLNALKAALLCLCFFSPIAVAIPSSLLLGMTEEQNVSATTASDAELSLPYQYKDSLQRDTPRGALNGFLESAYAQNYAKAAKYLDMRYLPSHLNPNQAEEYARQLHAIIERNVWINLQEINDTPAGAQEDFLPEYRDSFGIITIKDADITLLLQQVPSKSLGKIWKISNATVSMVPKLYEELGYGPLSEWFIENVPRGYVFKLNLWEIALLLSYLVASFLVITPFALLVSWLVRRSKMKMKEDLANLFSGPLLFFLALGLDHSLLSNTTLTVTARDFIDNGYLFFISSLWLGWALIGLLQYAMRERLIGKGNKQSAAMVRPFLTFFRIIVLVFAVLAWMEYHGFNATALLAGMGVGGVALALASKQSLENFIGTMTLYSAAPVKVGNFCSFGSIRGTVEEIGLRCTRVRTIDRTVIHVPNAKLAEMEIENISEREKIRFKTDIRLDYSTTTAQLKKIIEEIKALLENHEKVDKKPLRVTFRGFGAHGLEINVFAYIGSKSLPVYQVAAQELHLGIMEIVENNGSRIVPATFDAQALP
ncbi:mechanosensitive ion channel family protein [Vibrio sp. 05-20-BW147]|uniref:mechanosensitive ion channel family protein n=1 Tax=Vibrio sp. 05-20-BW147 TaxID=2575834 RepID=UPI001594D6B5|nr:mechanosensitive ion channel family protein [Vibrio sp. 05-20-BW147]NVC64969.1 mechanosensitive ion channel family protein [Vibrio sp. 05-20-BW147]